VVRRPGLEIMCHDAFTKQLEAMRLSLGETAPIAASFLSDFPAQYARGRQDDVAGRGARTLILPWLGVLTSWDNRLCPTLRDGYMTAFGVIGTIGADACDGLLCGIWPSRHGSIGTSLHLAH
jgi:hypothetical protein